MVLTPKPTHYTVLVCMPISKMCIFLLSSRSLAILCIIYILLFEKKNVLFQQMNIDIVNVFDVILFFHSHKNDNKMAFAAIGIYFYRSILHSITI